MPVPRVAPAPFHSCIGNVRLGYLPPGTHLVALSHRLAHQLLVGGVDEGIILQQEGSYEAILVELRELVGSSAVKVLVGKPRIARLCLTHKVHEVDDAGMLVYLALLARDEGYGGQHEGSY